MKLGIRALLRARWPAAPAPARAPRPRPSGRKSARAALACGLLAFAAANATLAAVLERSHREWRDPEFGHRLIGLRQRQAEAPRRPVVLAVGSSRVQQGLDAAAMGFPDGPADPYLFNFGYRGSSSVLAVLNVFRLLEAGVRPDYVLVEFTPAAVTSEYSAPGIVRRWPNRFTARDVRWMVEAEFLDPGAGRTPLALAKWAGTNAFPWTSHRQVLVPHWLPRWVPESQWKALGRERMDRYGFTAMIQESTTTQLYRNDPRLCREQFAPVAARTAVSANVRRAFAMLLGRCRAEGIPVAFVWVPLSPLLTGWLTPEARRASADYAAELASEWGAAVFPEPDWLCDDDFADGQHLRPAAAARYSRWLADTHLKPWLARHAR
jgi:hypothetical protein